MKKYGYCLVCSVVLVAILLYGSMKTEINTEKQYPLTFSIEHDSHNAAISIHESEEGIYYVFLPSYADLTTLKILTSEQSNVFLGDVRIADGMTCEEFNLETAYPLTVDGQYLAELMFYQSANVATMYIDTVTGSIDRLNRDKAYSEQASVMLYTAEGILNSTDSKAYIKGRGNATWHYGKKPYLLTLSSAGDLLGMGEATKWVLLANAADANNLNNKLVMDLARQTGQWWVPENAFVDLYVNGEYTGLYLLTEKVEVGPSRLDIDPYSDEFLCKVDLEKRRRSLKNPIKTQLGRTVEISSPDPLSEQERIDIINKINQMEEIIISGSDLSEVENFDLDSWVQKYLLDEISANIDADLVSSYFYYSDGVFFGGPVWDYDMSFGNESRNISSTAFLAKNKYKADGYQSLYYHALCANESFRTRMCELYQSEFLPVLNQLIEHGISDLAAEIQAASRMNDLCRRITEGRDPATVHTVDGLISYLEERVSFLTHAWLGGAEYCSVQFENSHNAPYMNLSVRKGNLLVSDHVDLENTVWIEKSTGNVVDFSQPIWSDMILMKQSNLNIRTIGRDDIDPYLMILSAGLLLVLLLGMTYFDITQRRKERRSVNESKRTHVSS